MNIQNIKKRIIAGGIISMLLLGVSPFYARAATEPDAATLAALEAQIKVLISLVAKLQEQILLLVGQQPQSGGGVTYPVDTFSIRMGGDALPDTVVVGSVGEPMADIILSTRGNKESVTLSSLPLVLEAPTDGSQTGIRACRLFDGATPLMSTSNSVHPLATKTDKTSHLFRFDTTLVISSDSSKTFRVVCDVIQSPPTLAKYRWYLGDMTGVFKNASTGANMTPAIGMLSSKYITLASHGDFDVMLSASSPKNATASLGSTSVAAAAFDMHASGEAIRLSTFDFQIDATDPRIVMRYALWDGATKVGEGTVPSGDRNVKAVLTGDFLIPRDGTKTLSLTVDVGTVAGVGSFAIGFNGSDGNYALTSGKGVSSGNGMFPRTMTDVVANAISLSGDTTSSVSGNQRFTMMPVPEGQSFAGLPILYRLKVSAGEEALSLAALSFSINPMSLQLKDLKIYAYKDEAFTVPVSVVNLLATRTGKISEGAPTLVNILFNEGSRVRTIPIGGVEYYELRGIISNSSHGSYIETTYSDAGTTKIIDPS